MNGFGFSLFVHVRWYACMLASPFALMRAPFGLSPATHSGFLAYSLCIANPVMIALGFLGADRASFEITVTAQKPGRSRKKWLFLFVVYCYCRIT